ncbi:hypothetical protein LPJ53_001555 [Coemansia erecta]|uniref:TH1 protein n=1 Tax=Coemansia erecta TaxID=147472 RepID=A0A9W7Y4P8_9FUNG|nr:hypothetical protein LPJ53_001555 [Coemansia erecta]
MEPTTPAFVDQYLEAGGAPFNIMNTLTMSYEGMAAMTNMINHDILHAYKDDENAAVYNTIGRRIVERFNASKADAEFDKTQKLPDYVEEMIPFKVWRKVIYRLSEQNPKSTMLSAALQKIADLGHQAELTSLSSASLHTHVFYALFVECFEKLTPSDDENIRERMGELFSTVCSSEQTYFVAQYILSKVRQRLGKDAESVRRIEQELESFMMDKFNRPQLAVNFRLLLDGFSVGSDNDVANSLASIVQSAYASPSDVTKLYKEYHGALVGGRKLPSLDSLRNERVLMPIIEQAFGHLWGNTAQNRNSDIMDRFMWLIACATHCTSDDPNHINKNELQELVRQMNELGNRLPVRPILTVLNRAIGDILRWINTPILARIIVLWLRDLLSYDEFTFYGTYFQGSNELIPLVLLEEVAYRHPLLKPLVLEVYKDSFNSKVRGFAPDKQIHLQKMVIDKMAALAQLDFALPVIRYISQTAELIDEGVLAYFIFRILSQFEAPYPEVFYIPMFGLIDITINAVKATAKEDERSVIRAFLKAVDDDRARSTLNKLPSEPSTP